MQKAIIIKEIQGETWIAQSVGRVLTITFHRCRFRFRPWRKPKVGEVIGSFDTYTGYVTYKYWFKPKKKGYIELDYVVSSQRQLSFGQ